MSRIWSADKPAGDATNWGRISSAVGPGPDAGRAGSSVDFFGDNALKRRRQSSHESRCRLIARATAGSRFPTPKDVNVRSDGWGAFDSFMRPDSLSPDSAQKSRRRVRRERPAVAGVVRDACASVLEAAGAD